MSVSSASSILSLTHPLSVSKNDLLQSLETKRNLQDALTREMNEMTKAITDIDRQIGSPTFQRTDIARSCVLVGTSPKTSKYRQLHITEDGKLYYKNNSDKKMKIFDDREIFKNADIRAIGKKIDLDSMLIISYFSYIHTGFSIWDGAKIARHPGDICENVEDLEDSFGVDESFEETPLSSPISSPFSSP